MKKHNLTKRREAIGWYFILPWFIGLILFFIQPMIRFFQYSFTEFAFTESGYTLNSLSDGIFSNYISAIRNDAEFPKYIFEAFKNLLYQAPVIVFFRLFSAIILSGDFKGRMAMRTVFFLPLIITSGIVADIIRSDMTSVTMMSSSGSQNIFDVSALTQYLQESGFPTGVVSAVTGLIANVADLVWQSSVQILIFLAALLAIPPSYFEVARVEGASDWETFWMVTFPAVFPFVAATVIYTVIDSFTSYGNNAMRHIRDYFMKDMKYSYAAAMSFIYFLLVILTLGIIFLVCRRGLMMNSERTGRKGK